MKRLILVLPLAFALAASAQTTKPSAAVARQASAQPASQQSTQAERPLVSQPETTDLALPTGTAVYMKLETPISTRTNKTGDRFAGRVTQPVMLNGKTIIPVGAGLEGTVMRAEEMRRIHGTPTIDLRPEQITMPDGVRYSINAVIVDANPRPGIEVNDEGQIKGAGHDGGDWKETGIATGAGALAGGLITHGAKGTFIGAGIGATASLIHWLAKTKSADLPAGTEIIMELSRPMAMSSSSSGQ